MIYRHSAGRLLWLVAFALFCASLAGLRALAQEIHINEAPALAQANPSASPAASGIAPAGQELPNLETIQTERLPTQAKPDASSRVINQGNFEIYGPSLDSATPISTIIINPGDHTIGNWHIRPTLSTAVTYDDNIFITSTDPQADVSFTISPGIAIGWGDFGQELLGDTEYEHRFQLIPDELERRDYFFARYTAHDNIFIDHSSQNGVDHDALLDTQFEFSKLTLGLKAAIQTLSNADIQLGTRLRRTIDSVQLTSKYTVSEKTSLEANFVADANTYQGLALDSTQLSNQDWFNYAVGQKLQASIGTNFSYLKVEQSPGQVAEQFLLRGVYQPSPKLQISTTIGVEFRQISGGPEVTDGVFNFSSIYKPFDGTMLKLQASRLTEGSPDIAGQDQTVTGVDAEIRQRLFQKFYVDLTAGYNHDVYRDILTLATQRVDDYVYVRPRLMFDVSRWASLQVSFEFKNNQSTSSFGFVDHVAMIQCDIVF